MRVTWPPHTVPDRRHPLDIPDEFDRRLATANCIATSIINDFLEEERIDRAKAVVNLRQRFRSALEAAAERPANG